MELIKDKGLLGVCEHLLNMRTHDKNYYSNLKVNTYE